MVVSSNAMLRVPTIRVPSALIAAVAALTRSSTIAATVPPSVRHGHNSDSSEKRQRTLPRTRWRMRRSSGVSTALRLVGGGRGGGDGGTGGARRRATIAARGNSKTRDGTSATRGWLGRWRQRRNPYQIAAAIPAMTAAAIAISFEFSPPSTESLAVL